VVHFWFENVFVIQKTLELVFGMDWFLSQAKSKLRITLKHRKRGLQLGYSASPDLF